MKTSLIALAALLAAIPTARAADTDEPLCGTPQSVSLTWNGQAVTDWVVAEDAIKRIDLPDGYPVGIMIGPARHHRFGPVVEITLFALDGPEPIKLTSTFGGVNSRQGYGARGGADRVVELGDPGILMTLTREDCKAPVPTPARIQAPPGDAKAGRADFEMTSRVVRYDRDRQEMEADEVSIPLGNGDTLTARSAKIDPDTRHMMLTQVALVSAGREVATAERATYDPESRKLVTDILRVPAE